MFYSWSVTSVPAGVFSPTIYGGNGYTSPGTLSATATFAGPGVYQFELDITDGWGLTASSTVSVTVVAQAPIITGLSANPNPVTGSTTVLAALVADSNPGQLFYSWSVVSVPAGVGYPTINGSSGYTSPGQISATASFVGQGVYQFELSITDGWGLTASSTVSVTVGELTPTTTTITSHTPDPSNSGQSVQFTVTVSPTVPNGDPVQLQNAGVNIAGAIGTLTNGSVTINVTSLPVGNDSVTAVYVGDAIYAASTSAAVTQTVNAATPITITSINLNAGTDPIVAASNPSAGVFSFTTDGANSFAVGDPVFVIGVGAPYDGTYTIASLGVNSFTVATSPSNSGQATVTHSGTATDSAQTGGLLINGASNATSQRSMVDSIVYTFNQPVNVAQADIADGNAFTITGAGSVPGTPPTWIYNSPDGGTTWIVTFIGASGGSIANGEYQIVLNNSAVSPVSGGGALANSDTESFYRLYGDVVGNGHYRVSASDNIAFLSTIGQTNTAAAFLAYLDMNDHGSINATDNINFLADFGTHYTGFAATI